MMRETRFYFGFFFFFNLQLADLAIPSKSTHSDWWRRHLQPKKPTYWLIVIRNNGNMDIYFMPDMKLAYMVTNVGNGNKFLSDSMEFVPLLLSQQSIEGNRDGSYSCSDATMPTEICMTGLGSYGRRPVLFVRTKTDVLIYRVSVPNQLAVNRPTPYHPLIQFICRCSVIRVGI